MLLSFNRLCSYLNMGPSYKIYHLKVNLGHTHYKHKIHHMSHDQNMDDDSLANLKFYLEPKSLNNGFTYLAKLFGKLLQYSCSLMVSVFVSSAVDREFHPGQCQTQDYDTGICCFSVKHAVLRGKSKDWLARNQDNVSEWSDISVRVLLFQ